MTTANLRSPLPRRTRDVEIPMSDGGLLRANVYLPRIDEPVPALVTMGPYGKDRAVPVTMPEVWARLTHEHPTVLSESTGQYTPWEVPDPERWTRHGYAVVHIDARGTGRSPGVWTPLSDCESTDFAEAVEWLAAQAWCTGKIGVLGVSYHAMAAWRLAERNPEHLAAIVPWFGSGDAYREAYRHGGILSNGFLDTWWYRWASVDHPEPLPDLVRRHGLFDEWNAVQAVDWSKIIIPFLSVGSWGMVGLHLRGNVEAFRHAASPEKWLLLLDCAAPGVDRFLDDEGFAVQLHFFDHYLRGEDNGWETRPPVTYELRAPDGRPVKRSSDTWPVEGTSWARLHLNATARTLTQQTPTKAGAVRYWPTSDGVTFRTEPVEQPTEIVGAIAVRLEVSTLARNLDVITAVRAVTADGRVAGPTTRGWLRLSHRELDERASTPWSPVHAHQRASAVVPGQRYVVDIEIWPTGVVIPPGGTLQLTILGRDPFDVGEWRHDDPDDRSNETFTGWTTIHTGPDAQSWLLLPVIP